jgi:hypothetical protein
MIHFRLDGIQISGNQSTLVFVEPYNSDNDNGPLVVTNVAQHVVIPAPATLEIDYLLFRNISQTGQTLFFDTVATVSTTSYDDILYPGECLEWVNTDLDVWCIADIAGAGVNLAIKYLSNP